MDYREFYAITSTIAYFTLNLFIVSEGQNLKKEGNYKEMNMRRSMPYSKFNFNLNAEVITKN